MSIQEFRIGFAGLTHGHVWGLIEQFKSTPGVVMAAVADEDSHLTDRVQGRFETTYQAWIEMLDKERLDGIVVATDNKMGADVAVEALRRGIPCFVEKPMASSVADADRMLDAHEVSGAVLLVNWPIAWRPQYREIAKRIAAGEIGPVFHAKFRIGHHGPKEIGCDPEFYEWLYDEQKNGGGAIADFCGYGAVIFRWIMGMPDSVFGIRGNFTKDYPVPDDHAICVLKYPKGSAIAEGTWATYGFDPSGNPVFHGPHGTLSAFGDEVVLNKGSEKTILKPEALPESNPAAYFIDRVRTGQTPEGILNPRLSADSVRIIDAAKRSAVSGCAEVP
jgi:predicted dehydrogenase